ncbi:Dam family site-specific DNA-(adenine-N6)-methyltransferase [Orbus mooreae]|uniref:Dam family site-specific DNA-(adenine-N6)-methyltransferase n=1 Tax=Orbus mooreae TaxID=3074107 RepID=UPI00370DE127
MKKQRAFLKWAGGKYSLVEQIIKHLPEGDLLVEPFVGAGSVFLNTNYERYILADINHDLIALFNTIKEQPEKFIDDARVLFNPQNNQTAAFYELRNFFNYTKSDYQKSLLFLYLNRHCYNGLCRYNSKGEFNVPFGQNYDRVYFPEDEIIAFSEKAQKAEFVCASYHSVMQNAQKGSVVYCDPPYVPLSVSSSFTSYYSIDFGIDDQKNLATLAENLAKKDIPVLISNHDTTDTRDWYQHAKLHSVTSRRSINSNGSGRKKIDELLALYS